MDAEKTLLASEEVAHDPVVDVNVCILDASLFKFGLPKVVDDTLRERFVHYSVHLYKKMSWKRTTLSECYADDFASLAAAYSSWASASSRRKLKDIFRSNGVFVLKGLYTLISDALHEIVQNKFLWPDNDYEAPSCNTRNSIKVTFDEQDSVMNQNV